MELQHSLGAVSSPESVESVIAQLLALPAAERAAFLDRVGSARPEWHDRLADLRRLLAVDSSGGSRTPDPFSADAYARILESARQEPDREAPGSRIGPYKLLQKLGEGGFGSVWLADQQEPIRRRVAVKIIKVGMDTSEVIARFEAERQALALMDHPNIARVLDAGATASGRPFFVMELVRGVAITTYCDDNRLSAEARLRLFIPVCHAVQHAHQKGVIHRDLKPSNILITLHDGQPVPKVIDFGIAKAIGGQQLTDRTLFTRFHAFIGTPVYTSPEQMEMSGMDVDTRSDIYSLGVLLYELLAGRAPFDAAALMKSGLEEMRRTVREVDPPRPSDRLKTLPASDRTTVAGRRDTDPARLSLLLRGDLDWIVMRCLEKDRTRRYESATALAADVGRHLENHPVSARPPSNAYKMLKFLRRHKLGAAAGAAVAASLVAGLVVSSVLLVRERAAHDRAVVAEHAESELRAQAEAGHAREIKRSTRAALNLAGQLLAEGRTADGIAYLVHAAQRDRENTAIAARLADTLTSRNFLIPERDSFLCGSRVLAMRYSNDGRALLVGTEDGTLRVFDPVTGSLTREIAVGHTVKRSGWLFARNDDRSCALRFANDTFGVLDTASGRLRFPPLTLDPRVNEAEGADPSRVDLDFVKISPDGRWIFAQNWYEYWLWDASDGKLVAQRSTPFFNYCAFSPDGSKLAVVSNDSLTLWSLPDFSATAGPIRIARSVGRPGDYLIPHFSLDGRLLVVVDPFEAIHVFDSATGALLRSWPHKDNWIIPLSLQVLPSGQLFATCALSTELWDLETGLAKQLPHIGWGQFQACVPDRNAGRILMVNPLGSAKLLESSTGRSLAEETALHGSGDLIAAMSPDGRQVVVGTGKGELRWLRVGQGAARALQFPSLVSGFTSSSTPRVRAVSGSRTSLIDVRTGAIVSSAPNPSVSPVRRTAYVLTAGGRFVLSGGPDGSWESWDFLDESAPTAAGLEGASSPFVAALSPDGGSCALFGPASREIGVWDLSTGKRVGPMVSYQGDSFHLWGVKLGPDARVLTTGHRSGVVAVWDTRTGRLKATLQSPARALSSVVMLNSAGDRVLVSNSWGDARMWDLRTGSPVGPTLGAAPSGASGGILSYSFFSPDDRWIASSDSRGITFRDATTFSPAGNTIPVRLYAPYGSVFNSDGTRLATDKAVWEVPGGDMISDGAQLAGLERGIWDIGFSVNGRYYHCQGDTASGRSTFITSVPPSLPAGTSTPDWLLDLATMIAGKAIDEQERCVAIPADGLRVESVRRTLAGLPADAPYAEWGRWILDERPDRPIAPGFTITGSQADLFASSGYLDQ